ncbi:MAG: ribonuclease H [Satyrvirus sp.]|uniref:ribonuclease H n=1 Tax=Satyrvirus sp. TaxID=2487771 RepID=A0A3G5AD72_9VIRU|nr:MAG: ribonuclease H [Satyrvirus sp.]
MSGLRPKSKSKAKPNNSEDIIVYTDGSCVGNGKISAVGGIGIHFPNNELKDVSKIFRFGCCTNQRTELYAILFAFKYIKQNLGLDGKRIIIKTDSQYCVDSITNWVYGWIKNGWRTKSNKPVANKEFIEAIHKYYERYDILLEHVQAHTGLDDEDSVANAKADALAVKATNRALLEQQQLCPNKKKPGRSSTRPAKQAKQAKRSKLSSKSSNRLPSKQNSKPKVQPFSIQMVGKNISRKITDKPNQNFKNNSKNNFPQGNLIVELIKSK